MELELCATSATEVTSTRHELLAALQRWSCGGACDIALVFSELVTNAILYGSGASSIVVDHHDHEVRLAVHDTSSTPPVMRAEGNADGGFGLRIVDQLATSWGWEPTAVGKQVWAVMPC